VVRRSYEAWMRGEAELAADAWDPVGEWRPAMAGTIESEVYQGQSGARRYFDELSERFSEVRLSGLEFRDFGDRVLVLYALSIRGRESGVAVEQLAGAVYTLRDRKIVDGRSYLSRREALQAVGLLE
jgi:ketosteroid isomerase-like protein